MFAEIPPADKRAVIPFGQPLVHDEVATLRGSDFLHALPAALVIKVGNFGQGKKLRNSQSSRFLLRFLQQSLGKTLATTKRFDVQSVNPVRSPFSIPFSYSVRLTNPIGSLSEIATSPSATCRAGMNHKVAL